MYSRKEFRDVTGRWRTSSLFVETIQKASKESGYKPIYCLNRGHPSGLPCLRDLYMEFEDPTEYMVAEECLGGWDHWMRLCENKWFQEIVEDWRAELEVKIRSKNIANMAEIALSGTGQATQASKWLAEAKWKQTRRGRKTKEEIEKEKEIENKARDSLSEEGKRVFTVLDGGKSE